MLVDAGVFVSRSGAVTAITSAPSGAVMTIDRTATVKTCNNEHILQTFVTTGVSATKIKKQRHSVNYTHIKHPLSTFRL